MRRQVHRWDARNVEVSLKKPRRGGPIGLNIWWRSDDSKTVKNYYYYQGKISLGDAILIRELYKRRFKHPWIYAESIAKIFADSTSDEQRKIHQSHIQNIVTARRYHDINDITYFIRFAALNDMIKTLSRISYVKKHPNPAAKLAGEVKNHYLARSRFIKWVKKIHPNTQIEYLFEGYDKLKSRIACGRILPPSAQIHSNIRDLEKMSVFERL